MSGRKLFEGKFFECRSCHRLYGPDMFRIDNQKPLGRGYTCHLCVANQHFIDYPAKAAKTSDPDLWLVEQYIKAKNAYNTLRRLCRDSPGAEHLIRLYMTYYELDDKKD